MAKKRKYKKRPIVTGYLEKVSSSIFDSHSKIIAEMVQGEQGLYALYRKNKLYYVGLARNLKSRVNQHVRDKHAGKWTHFSLYVIHHAEHIKELESLLLRIAYPAGNSVKGQLRRSANMLPSLKRKTKAAAIAEWKSNFESTSQGKKKAGRTKAQTVAWQTMRGERPCKGLFPKTLRIYAPYKGELYKAWLRPSGLIKFDGKNYDSPSMAGTVARGGKATNGWVFWRVKQGERLVRLKEFRR
jgi:predicted GIY-YIG superfamily endonuclease